METFFDTMGSKKAPHLYLYNPVIFLARRLIDGIIYEKLAEEFDMSVRQIKNIVYKRQEQIRIHGKDILR